MKEKEWDKKRKRKREIDRKEHREVKREYEREKKTAIRKIATRQNTENASGLKDRQTNTIA